MDSSSLRLPCMNDTSKDQNKNSAGAFLIPLEHGQGECGGSDAWDPRNPIRAVMRERPVNVIGILWGVDFTEAIDCTLSVMSSFLDGTPVYREAV